MKPQSVNKILAHDKNVIAFPHGSKSFHAGFEAMTVTVLFADLRGFSVFFSEYSTDIVIAMLNRFLSRMSLIVEANHGRVDKFIGDSIMATFGAPESRPDDVLNALKCAVEMQLAMDEINAENQELDLPSIYLGVGINTGEVVAGRFGSDVHSEYTVIGECVNLASRIESFSLRGQILIGERTLMFADAEIQVSSPIDLHVKGKHETLVVFELLSMPKLGLIVPRREQRRSPRVKVNLPFTYRNMDGKIVNSRLLHGTILDLSYYGAKAEIIDPIKTSQDIKLTLDLNLIGYDKCDIYAKITKIEPQQDGSIVTLEFSSISKIDEARIRYFVQMLVQGCESLVR